RGASTHEIYPLSLHDALPICKTGGRVRDDRWMDFTAELFQWHHRNERWLRNVAPLAQVGVVYSQRNATRYGRPWRRDDDPTMRQDRKSTRLNSSHVKISYAVF